MKKREGYMTIRVTKELHEFYCNLANKTNISIAALGNIAMEHYRQYIISEKSNLLYSAAKEIKDGLDCISGSENRSRDGKTKDF